MKQVQVAALLCVAVAALGCGEPVSTGSGADAGDGGSHGGDGGTGTVWSPSLDAGLAEGLPCDVYGVLRDDCLSCHGKPLTGGATVRLVSRADLTALSPAYPDQTLALRALARMGAHESTQMPPLPASMVPPGDYTTLLSWVNAGMPAGFCDPNAPQPTVCTSGHTWTSGNSGSAVMNPGMACLACHVTFFDAPKYTAAGTVYPSRHEADRCNGTNGLSTPTTVEITDAQGTVRSAQVNSAGNFYFSYAFVLPITARVTKDGRTRAMVAAQPSADCNSCHTEQGLNGAPGRIIEP